MSKFRDFFQEYSFLNNVRLLATNIRGDILGGSTVAFTTLPLVLALGIASGLGVKAAIIGVIILGFVAALFGGTPTQISGPTAPMAIVVAALALENSYDPYMIFGIIAMAGIIQIIFGLTKVGKYIQYMPYPVVSGFMTGIGIIIFIIQINPFLGLKSQSGVIDTLIALPKTLVSADVAALAVGCFTLILLYTCKKIHKAFPSAILAILFTTLLTKMFDLNLPTIGNIPKGLPTLHIPDLNWNTLQYMIGPATALAGIGLLDSLLTSLVADRMTKKRHNSNRELVGQGLGNYLSGILGGLPGAGATIRTEININAGGKTPLSGITYSMVTLIIVFFLGPWIKDVPLSCLAAILFKAAFDIIDKRSLRQFIKIPLFDSVVLLTVLSLTVAINILVAVGIGLLLACILFVKRMGDLLDIAIITLNDMEKPWVAHEPWREMIDKEEKGKILVFQMNGPLFFGASSNFLKSAEKHKDFRGLILRMHRVPEVDTTGAYALEELAEFLQERGKFLYISGLAKEPREFLRKLGIMDIIKEENIFLRFEEAANHAANDLLKERGE
jgi:sulfate permease, SulP family